LGWLGPHQHRLCLPRTYRRHRTMRRLKVSRSVKKKSPTSVWRRSTSSTRRTSQVAFRWRGAVAVAAEVAEAAAAVGVAEAVAAAAVAAEAAAFPGAPAAGCARPDGFPTILTNRDHHGRVRQGRPGQSMSSLQFSRIACMGGSAGSDRAGLKPHRDMLVPELDQETLHPGAGVSRWRSGMASNRRALTS
jgi:hypothetical protein